MESPNHLQRINLATSRLLHAIYPPGTTVWNILAAEGWSYDLQNVVYESHLTRFQSRLLFFWYEIIAAEISPWAAYAIFRAVGLGQGDGEPSIAQACGWSESEHIRLLKQWMSQLSSDRCRRLLSRFAGTAFMEIGEVDYLRVEAPEVPAPAEDLMNASAQAPNPPRGKLAPLEQAAFEFATEHPEGSYRTTIARVLIGSDSKMVAHLRGHRLFGRFRYLSRQIVMFVLDNMIDTGRLRVLEDPPGHDLEDW
jgi:hypothetical protein